MEARVAAVVAERERLSQALSSLPVDVFPSAANFVLFRPHATDALAVWKGLVERSVLVRDCSSWPRLAGCLRVTVGTVEDVGILLGESLREALGDKAGVRRFASISLPLDEALVEVALDLSGRPYLHYDVEPGGEALGQPPFDPQLAEEFWRAFVTAAGITLHVRMVSGKNSHHILEASFKGVARALPDAVRIEARDGAVPSTKGTL